MNRVWIYIIGMVMLLVLGASGYIAKTTLDERPLVIVIPSYNNKQWYKKNLDSVFAQRYSNYRVIYIDDCSCDGTATLVADYVQACNQQQRFTLMRNKSRKRALANHYAAVHACADHEIVVNLDGDDWFKHDHVLQRVNKAYTNPHVWLTYGQYEEYPSGKKGHCRKLLDATVKLNCYRECEWVTSALRTFYAGLFKQIKLEDLVYNGDFFQTACDLAFMYPMLEMAAGRCTFIDDILYVYNCDTPHNDFKESFLLQTHLDNYIRSRPKYTKIKDFYGDGTPSVDIVIVSDNNPQQLRMLLNSVRGNVTGFGAIHVVYTHDTDDCYRAMRSEYETVVWHLLSRDTHGLGLANVLGGIHAEYIAYVPDTIYVYSPIDLTECASLLNTTSAFGFCLSLGKNICRSAVFVRPQHQPRFTMVSDTVCAWSPVDAEADWKVLGVRHMVVYPKQRFIAMVQDVHCHSLMELDTVLSHISIGKETICLCYNTSRAVIVEPLRIDGNSSSESLILPNDAVCVTSYPVEQLLTIAS